MTADAKPSRAVRAVLGHPATRRLSLVHAIDDLADAFVTVSLLGSLFLSVSAEASRQRVLIYLSLTVAPLVVLAPTLGPLLERTRAGFRGIIVGSELARAAAALGLAFTLQSPAMYPLAFVVLLSRKAYALARTAMVPQLVTEPGELASASGHLSRVGSFAGAAGAGIASLLLRLQGAAALPIAAAVLFVVAGLLAGRIPAVTRAVDDTVGRDPVPPQVRVAGLAVCGLRAAAGALTYLLALAIKRGGGDRWIFVAALSAAGVASYLGTMVAGQLNRRMRPPLIVLLILAVPGVVTLLGVLTAGNKALIVIAFVIGLGGSVATRTMDALYGAVPDHSRGRVISANELRFQLSSVAGAIFAVMLTPTPKLGFAAAAAVLLLSALWYGVREELLGRAEAISLLTGLRRSAGQPLPEALLAEARYLRDASALRLAALNADLAVQAALAHGAPAPAGWDELERCRRRILAGQEPDADDVGLLIAAAHEAVTRRE